MNDKVVRNNDCITYNVLPRAVLRLVARDAGGMLIGNVGNEVDGAESSC